MRVAPVALIVDDGGEAEAEKIFHLARDISWITHGHTSGYLSAAAFAVIIHAALWGKSLRTGIERAENLLEREDGSTETLVAIRRAIAYVEAGFPPEAAIPRIGDGWVGEEALGVTLYCALTASDFESAVRMAVNHDGDSDTTGSLVGQVLGMILGEGAIPDRWLRDLELRETIADVATDLAGFLRWELDLYESDGFTDRIWERYPGW